MKKVCHISSDFLYTDVYNQLFLSLSNGTKNQLVYSAIKSKDACMAADSTKYNTVISPILGISDRLFFKKRVHNIYDDICSKVNVLEFDLVHAHFLFTDGAVALKLFQNFKKPYIVAVRNTDLNIYFKYFFHLRKLAFNIIFNAQKVILLSPSYKEKVLEFFSESQSDSMKNKMVIIPNGIDKFWIDNSFPKLRKKRPNELKFLFVGEITLNKNLEQTITLINSLLKTYKVQLTIIGKKMDGFKQLSKLMRKHPWVLCIDPIIDKNILKSHFREADIFIMLSKHETFGLVYIESLSQGTPILYTKGQGIDGYFPEGSVGFNFDINQNSQSDFEEKIEIIIKKYDSMSSAGVKESSKFDWADIAGRYLSIYNVM